MQQQNSILRAVISILIGVIIIAVPGLTLTYLIITIGAVLLILGAVYIIGYYSKNNNSDQKRITPYGGIICFIAGLLFVIKPIAFLNIFTIILGIILILGSIGQFMSLSLFKRYTKVDWTMYVTPTLISICGILLLTNPFSSAVTIVTIFGISILVYGVLEIVSYYKFKNIEKK